MEFACYRIDGAAGPVYYDYCHVQAAALAFKVGLVFGCWYGALNIAKLGLGIFGYACVLQSLYCAGGRYITAARSGYVGFNEPLVCMKNTVCSVKIL